MCGSVYLYFFCNFWKIFGLKEMYVKRVTKWIWVELGALQGDTFDGTNALEKKRKARSGAAEESKSQIHAF